MNTYWERKFQVFNHTITIRKNRISGIIGIWIN